MLPVPHSLKCDVQRCRPGPRRESLQIRCHCFPMDTWRLGIRVQKRSFWLSPTACNGNQSTIRPVWVVTSTEPGTSRCLHPKKCVRCILNRIIPWGRWRGRSLGVQRNRGDKSCCGCLVVIGHRLLFQCRSSTIHSIVVCASEADGRILLNWRRR